MYLLLFKTLLKAFLQHLDINILLVDAGRITGQMAGYSGQT